MRQGEGRAGRYDFDQVQSNLTAGVERHTVLIMSLSVDKLSDSNSDRPRRWELGLTSYSVLTHGFCGRIPCRVLPGRVAGEGAMARSLGQSCASWNVLRASLQLIRPVWCGEVAACRDRLLGLKSGSMRAECRVKVYRHFCTAPRRSWMVRSTDRSQHGGYGTSTFR